MTSTTPGTAVPERMVSEAFARVFQAYMEASDEVQSVIRDMCAIVNDPQSDGDEVAAAVDTLVEALFPWSHNGELGIDISDLRKSGIETSKEVEDEFVRFDEHDRTFAERLKALLDERGMTQESLAHAIGVQQPAISMMLSRQCHPQRRTIQKIAKALGIDEEQLWPGSQ